MNLNKYFSSIEDALKLPNDLQGGVANDVAYDLFAVIGSNAAYDDLREKLIAGKYLSTEKSAQLCKAIKTISDITYSKDNFESIFNKPSIAAEQIEAFKQQRDNYVKGMCTALALDSSKYQIALVERDIDSVLANTIALVDEYGCGVILLNTQLFFIDKKPVIINKKLRNSIHGGLLGAANALPSIQQLLGVVATLSFGLPPPWGVAVAAGFQLVGAVIGSVGNASSVNSMNSQLKTMIQEAFATHDIGTYAASLASYSNQFSIYMGVLDKTPDNIDYIKAEVIPFLKTQKIEGTATPYDSFQQIVTKKYYWPNSGCNDKLAQFSLKLLSQLAFSIMLNQRSLIEMLAQQASLNPVDRLSITNIWLGEYEELRVLLIGDSDPAQSMAGVLSSIWQQIYDYRMSCLNLTWISKTTGWGGNSAGISDTWLGTNVGGQFDPLGSTAFDDWESQWNQKYAEMRNSADADIKTWLSECFGGDALATSFKKMIEVGNSIISPRIINNTLTVEFTTPSTSNLWAEPQKLIYDIRLFNQIGFVDLDPVQNITSIAGKIPSLKNIPVDPLFLTGKKIIYRTGSDGKKINVATIPNAQTTFEDTAASMP